MRRLAIEFLIRYCKGDAKSVGPRWPVLSVPARNLSPSGAAIACIPVHATGAMRFPRRRSWCASMSGTVFQRRSSRNAHGQPSGSSRLLSSSRAPAPGRMAACKLRHAPIDFTQIRLHAALNIAHRRRNAAKLRPHPDRKQSDRGCCPANIVKFAQDAKRRGRLHRPRSGSAVSVPCSWLPALHAGQAAGIVYL